MHLMLSLERDEEDRLDLLIARYRYEFGFSKRALVGAALHLFSLKKEQVLFDDWESHKAALLAWHSKSRGRPMSESLAIEDYGVIGEHTMDYAVGSMEQPDLRPRRNALLKCTRPGCNYLYARGLLVETAPPCPTTDHLASFRCKFDLQRDRQLEHERLNHDATGAANLDGDLEQAPASVRDDQEEQHPRQPMEEP